MYSWSSSGWQEKGCVTHTVLDAGDVTVGMLGGGIGQDLTEVGR